MPSGVFRFVGKNFFPNNFSRLTAIAAGDEFQPDRRLNRGEHRSNDQFADRISREEEPIIRKVGSAFFRTFFRTSKRGGFRDGSQPLIPIRLIIVSSFGHISVSRLENDRQGQVVEEGIVRRPMASSPETIIFAEDPVATAVIAVFYRPMSPIE